MQVFICVLLLACARHLEEVFGRIWETISCSTPVSTQFVFFSFGTGKAGEARMFVKAGIVRLEARDGCDKGLGP